MEAPRVTLIGPPMAPPVELQRWLRDSRRQAYEFKPRAAGLHALASARHKAPIELPLMLFPEGAVGGLLPSVKALEERLSASEGLFPGEHDREFVEGLCETLFSPAVQTFYFHMLPVRAVLSRRATAGMPLVDRIVVRLGYPLWRRVMSKGLHLDGFQAEEAAKRIDRSFDLVERELNGRDFLGGTEPSIRDIVFAVIASPHFSPGSSRWLGDDS